MKKILFVATITFLLAPVMAFCQGSQGVAPRVQQMTILPPSIASEINCCVTPFNKVFISSKTEVFWDNQSGSNVKLTFGKGTICKQIAGPSGTHEVNTLGCYVIENLPQGSTETLRFTDQGRYDYTIEFLGMDRKPETGSISVF